MQFSKAVHSQKAATHKMATQVMSEILEYTARHIETPKKVKVIWKIFKFFLYSFIRCSVIPDSVRPVSGIRTLKIGF